MYFYAGGGQNSIQGICKIQLKNGKIIEGVILVAGGGWVEYCDTNGFYLINKNGNEEPKLFDKNFIEIQPSKGSKTDAGNGYFVAEWDSSVKVYFLHDITSKKYYYGDTETTKITEIVKDDQKPLILKRDIVHHFVYELLTYVTIYTEIPKELFVNRENISSTPMKIEIIDIDKFELIRNPNIEWLDLIASKEKAWRKENPDTLGESHPPSWFHDVIKRKELEKEHPFKPWKY